jgi:hypothetical protein
MKKESAMKYEVEFRRVSFITVTVEADNDNHAEDVAWSEIKEQANADAAEWSVESVEEVLL